MTRRPPPSRAAAEQAMHKRRRAVAAKKGVGERCRSVQHFDSPKRRVVEVSAQPGLQQRHEQPLNRTMRPWSHQEQPPEHGADRGVRCCVQPLEPVDGRRHSLAPTRAPCYCAAAATNKVRTTSRLSSCTARRRKGEGKASTRPAMGTQDGRFT